MINISRIQAGSRCRCVHTTTYELHSEIINQSLNICAGERSVGVLRAEYCITRVPACICACVHAYDHIPRGVRMTEDPVRAPSSIRRAECKRVYALRQVCGRVNYALSRRVYRHPVNLHRPCGLHSTPRYVRSSVPTHPSIGVPTLHAHESTTEASGAARR